MDVELEEFFVEPCFPVEETEVDFDYEFDAAMYYDFSRPETDFEAHEAELWFQTAPCYPSSPVVLKYMNPGLSTTVDDSVVTAMDDNNGGLKSCNQETTRAKTKSPLSKNSNFMNPTASHLAKQNHRHYERLQLRFKKSVKIEENGSWRSSVVDSEATKRQKLEAGYLRKVARLKHQTSFSHKAPKKVDINVAVARPKVTIPKQPNLETAYRAQRHRSRINLNSAESKKSNACTFRARPLNKKILLAPSFPLPKKSTPQQPEFQVFRLRTLERAMQHASVDAANIPNCGPMSQDETTESRGVNSSTTLKEKTEAPDTFNGRCLNKKELNSPIDKRFPKELPIDSFSKLSLASEVNFNMKPQSKMPLHFKGSKENAPCSLHLAQEIITAAKSQRFSESHYNCASENPHRGLMGPQINVNRSLNIR